MASNPLDVKSQILAVLMHPEADEGLYFSNFLYLHEEDERPAVSATEESLLAALKELVKEGRITVEETDKGPVFALSPQLPKPGREKL